MHDTLALVGAYHKSRSRTGRDKFISRYLPKELSNLWVLFLVLVAFMERVAMTELKFTLEMQGIASQFAFTSMGYKLEATHICTLFKHNMVNRGFELGIHDYRHIVIAFSEKHFPSSNIEFSNATIHAQAGHSSQIANSIYALSTSDYCHISRSNDEKYFNCSQNWHDLLKLRERNCHLLNTFPQKGIFPKTAHQHLDQPMPKSIIAPFHDVSIPPADRCPKKTEYQSNSTPPLKTCKVLVPLIEDSLHSIEGDLAQFKSSEQLEAIEAIINTHNDILVVLPTGGGKSLCFILPAMILDDGITVVIIPLHALLADLLKRCLEKNIPTIQWQNSTDSSIARTSKIILVSAEAAISEPFAQFLTGLAESHMVQTSLRRFVIDECHLLWMWADFRPILSHVLMIRQWAVPIILLSASLPPTYESKVCDSLGVSNIQIVRKSTECLEIGYHVKLHSSNDSMELTIAAHTQLVEDMLMLDIISNPGQVLVFCLTKREAYSVRNLIQKMNQIPGQIEVYHGTLPRDIRTVLENSWNSGAIKVMVCTSAFGIGIQSPNIRVILHINGARSLLDYSQESGRSGRDGRNAIATTIWQPTSLTNYIAHIEDNSKKEDASCMQTWLADVTSCRRQRLQQVLDGPSSTATCLQYSECALCDVCLSLSLHENVNKLFPLQRRDNELNIPTTATQRALRVKIPQLNHKNGTKHGLITGPGMFPEKFTHPTHHSEVVNTYNVKVVASAKANNLHRLHHLDLTFRIIAALEISRRQCQFCLLLNSDQGASCTLMGCPQLVYRCFRCMQVSAAHTSRNCPFKICVPPGHCSGCMLPGYEWYGPEHFHKQGFGANTCDSGGRDIIIPLVYLLWEERQYILQEKFELNKKDKKMFSQWLSELDSTHNLPNCIHLFLWWISNMTS